MRGTKAGKRALTNVGGRVERRGDPAAAALLAAALEVDPARGPGRLTHGFHTYPARIHPETAARLVAGLTSPGQTVLDPFCGSGTVLVEALVAGRRGVGRDLSPFAIRLAGLKTAVTSETQRRALKAAARRISSAASGRAKGGAPPREAGAAKLGEAFDPVTFSRLAWLRRLVAAERDPFARAALELVLSAILVKVSSLGSETGPRPRRGPGPPRDAASLFRDKALELSRMLEALGRAARASSSPDGRRGVDLAVDDARSLATVEPGSAHAIVTSPPYPNVYDYAEHHALRVAWLGLDDSALRSGEVGARRTFAEVERGLERWGRDGLAWTAALGRALAPGGRAAVLGGDGATAAGPVRFDEGLAGWARAAGLTVLAEASQKRPVFDEESRRAFRGSTRREHLVLLEKPGTP